jgi:hypothetical protein
MPVIKMFLSIPQYTPLHFGTHSMHSQRITHCIAFTLQFLASGLSANFHNFYIYNIQDKVILGSWTGVYVTFIGQWTIKVTGVKFDTIHIVIFLCQ